MTVVDTPSGRLRGRIVEGVAGGPPVRVWRGVPYAAPPVGPRRWRPPDALAPWVGVRDAIEPPARCPQPPSMLAPPAEAESEDCLAANVWSPEGADRLPVMVWLHGGSFVSGSGSIAWYDGARLASRGVVVVTVNYRLGPFGFLHLDALAGGRAEGEWAGAANCGLLDQAAALRWVRDHAEAFGGDPGRVTLFGESAGAMSTSHHLALPSSAGLFRRAIAQSGASGHLQDAARGEAVARRFVAELGLGPSELARLRDVPADALVRAATAVIAQERHSALPLPFQPTVDGTVLPVATTDALRAGAAAGVELLTGTNRDEMHLFRLVAAVAEGVDPSLSEERLVRRVARTVEAWGVEVDPVEVIAAYRAQGRGADPSDVWMAVATDVTFATPMVEMLDAHHAGGGRAWSYHFTHASTAFGGALGAAHAVEIPFVFDNVGQHGAETMLGELGPECRRFAASLADAWVAFAVADDPASTMRLPGTDERWPAYEPSTRRQAVLDLEPGIVARLDDDLRRRWRRDGAGDEPPTARVTGRTAGAVGD